jgi:hypothetical protein
MRAAQTSELRTPKHIVNEINYSFISQQPWFIGIITYKNMPFIWYLASLGSLVNFYNLVAKIYIFITFINITFGNF